MNENKKMNPEDRVILALDTPDYVEALDIVRMFRNEVGMFKVGSELFTSAGPAIIERIHALRKKVFLDLKFHDIPTTVSRAAAAASRLGVFMLNIHTMGGRDMMKAAVDAVVNASLKYNTERPRIVGVTLLTSIDNDTLSRDLGIQHNVRFYVKYLAKLAYHAGLDGVVASPQETEVIRNQLGGGFLIVTPGIRPSWSRSDDQKRTLTPKQAIRKGSDYLVIGRAVMSQPDPTKALQRIYKEIENAL